VVFQAPQIVVSNLVAGNYVWLAGEGGHILWFWVLELAVG